MTTLTAIEEAAQFLASGKSEAMLTKATHALADMNYAVSLLNQRTPEVLMRALEKDGTKRLSFVMGKVNINPLAVVSNIHEASETSTMLAKAKGISQHLTSRGVDAERINLATSDPEVVRHAVDVVLNEKVLQYTPGPKTAAEIERHGIEETSRVNSS